jgi:hypothetical protein
MGFFYTSSTLKGPTQEQVIAHLREQGRDAFVSPTVQGVTVAYDQACEDQDTDLIQAVTGDLSRTFDCPALAVLLHDDDVLMYWLFRSGRLVDEYNSDPAYWDDSQQSEPSGGNPHAICAAFGVERAEHEVEAILRNSWDIDKDEWPPDDYLAAEERHQALARTLGLPSYCYSMGYDSIQHGNVPEGVDVALLIRTIES